MQGSMVEPTDIPSASVPQNLLHPSHSLPIKVSSISTTNENKGVSITRSHEVHGKSSTDGTSSTAGKSGNLSLDALTKDHIVHQVDYACTPEEVQQHFQSCGTVNRVTILTDKFGHPKGFAYVEFVEAEAVQEALLLNETELHGRQLKVQQKRTKLMNWYIDISKYME
ncbi:polyadenylate-binding protein 3-like isoform X2 [Cucumis melo var. makuwa]|uniref:Polyadenylate-binding protein 3-like isoform X2 n=1 Tax=Cucumis melo var. makuwa TaxID=1194695 RepID=A0A5A7V432_CUCMM|nr:polyadenylate-binding protein 3-like isoform X2 [Cucumis melo var. makuwa]